MLIHDDRVSPVIIPIGHMGEEADDPSLHKICISCANFRGKDNGAIQPFIQDSLAEMYEELLLNTKEEFTIPEDFVDTIAITIAELPAEKNRITLKNTYLLYLMECNMIYNVGGISSPYASMEWPGIQIPQAISTMIRETRLSFPIVTDIGCYEEGILYFYERNPARRGLDFAENPEQEEDYLRYAVEMHCLNLIQDIAQCPLPQFKEIARGTEILLDAFLQPRTHQRKDLEATLRAEGTT